MQFLILFKSIALYLFSLCLKSIIFEHKNKLGDFLNNKLKPNEIEIDGQNLRVVNNCKKKIGY